MPLTHVCVWDNKDGYRQITIEEAAQMYPYGVSANRGIFVCSLCAQNVGLTAPGARPCLKNKSCTNGYDLVNY